MKIEGMIYNKTTLAFCEKDENLFQQNYFSESIAQLRVALILLSVLYGLFGFLDVHLFPELALTFLKIRFFIVIPLLLGVFLLSFTKLFRKTWQGIMLICFIVGGTGISVMTMHEPENYIYYTGMMLIFFSGYLFIKLRFFLATVGGWVTLIIFNLITIFYADASNMVIVSTNFFFVSANLIGMFSGYQIELQIRRNFFLNQNLDSEKLVVEKLNKKLEKKVTYRTQELIKAKEATEVINANITAIIEGTTESIWAFNSNYEILYINKIFREEFNETFGINLASGVSLVDSLPEAIRPFWKLRYDRVLANEQFTIEDSIDTGIGKVYIQVSFNPILKQGKVVGGSCIGSNITHRKRAELELLKAKKHAEESDQLKSAFLANMSHEIRTPMNGILGFAELLKAPNLTGEEQNEYIGIIEKSGTRMLNIINDIVDISKIEAGLMEIAIKETNVNEQIEFIYSFFKPETDAKGLQFRIKNNLTTNKAIIKTDGEKLYAILTNLVKNAIKCTQQGFIEFGFEIKGSMLEFFIKDTGIGIPLDRQQAIFERFVQAEKTHKMSEQGTGLGLSISKAFIEMLGGEIWMESEKDQGTTFYFTLPYMV